MIPRIEDHKEAAETVLKKIEISWKKDAWKRTDSRMSSSCRHETPHDIF